MSYIASNITAILAATVVGLLIGAAFRAVSPSSEGVRRSPVLLLGIALVAEGWLAAILAGALILAPVQANAWVIAIVTAVVIWIGFVLPPLVVSYLARGLRIWSLVLDCAHWLAVMTAQAAVLHLVGLTHP